MNKIYITTLIAAFLTIVALGYALDHARAESARYKADRETLLVGIEYYKTESGKSAATVQKLTLTNSELRKKYDEIAAVADELNIKLKRIQSASTTSTNTKVEIRTVVRDSIVYVHGEPLRSVAFGWRDPWTDIRGTIYNDSVDVNIEVNDTLVQIVHRVPHKFLFIKWGCKAIRQDIVAKNPHTKITYAKYIELKK